MTNLVTWTFSILYMNVIQYLNLHQNNGGYRYALLQTPLEKSKSFSL
jgi:hypothetical protein